MMPPEICADPMSPITWNLPYVAQIRRLPSPDEISSWQAALGEEESRIYRALKTPKRRREWLGGRIAAKQLVLRILTSEDQTGQASPAAFPDIQLLPLSSGEPRLRITHKRLPNIDLPISLSHCGEYACCAATSLGSRIGIDLEQVSNRATSWLELLAHETERSRFLEDDPSLQTALWTLKEATLKLLGIGLSTDLWNVRVLAAPEHPFQLNASCLEFHGGALAAWDRLGRPAIFHRTWPFGDRRSYCTVATTSRFATTQPSGGTSHDDSATRYA